VGIQRGGGVGVGNDWSGHNLLDWDDDFLQGGCRVSSVSRLLDNSVEAGVFVSCVVHGTDGAVRLNQLIVTRDFIAVTFLSLLLNVTSMVIFHSVLELIVSRRLKRFKVNRCRIKKMASFCMNFQLSLS
jgi:hypothetical protein